MGKLAYLENLETEAFRYDSLKQSLGALHEALEAITQRIEMITERVSASEQAIRNTVLSVEIPDHSKALSSLLNSDFETKSMIESLRQAVSDIRIPEVPPFPEIPQPKETDLSGVMAQLMAIRLELQKEDEPEVEMEEEDERPKKWTFDVQRNNFGLIEKVVVEETDD